MSIWLIYAKFGDEMQNYMKTEVTWRTQQFSKIQDGRRPPFWKI